MKSKLKLVLAGLFLFSQAAMAQTTLTVSATIPTPNALTLTLNTYLASNGTLVSSATSPSSISFGTLTFNPTTSLYLPTNYFAVLLGTNGAGTPIVNVQYTEGTGIACPNIAAGNSSTLGCLGTKTTATFVMANSSTGTETVSTMGPQGDGKIRLIDLTGTEGEMSSIPAGDYEKVYVGIWTGSTTSPADPSNGKPFTNSDAGGSYQGTLTFSVVSI